MSSRGIRIFPRACGFAILLKILPAAAAFDQYFFATQGTGDGAKQDYMQHPKKHTHEGWFPYLSKNVEQLSGKLMNLLFAGKQILKKMQSRMQLLYDEKCRFVLLEEIRIYRGSSARRYP
jgi:hypothetical protein